MNGPVLYDYKTGNVAASAKVAIHVDLEEKAVYESYLIEIHREEGLNDYDMIEVFRVNQVPYYE